MCLVSTLYSTYHSGRVLIADGLSLHSFDESLNFTRRSGTASVVGKYLFAMLERRVIPLNRIRGRLYHIKRICIR